MSFRIDQLGQKPLHPVGSLFWVEAEEDHPLLVRLDQPQR
jgi:hypothetical protein